MTKRELLEEYSSLLAEKRLYKVDGIGPGSNKQELQNAIDCLRCPDETMADYLTVVKLAYPNIYRAITQSNYLRHQHNRLYVYNTARAVLASAST